jgi:pimeloyl-ACP methyl ester carboxylesterase
MQATSELHHVSTRDGWKIALHNYRQRSPATARDTILLCHGLSVNRYNMDAPGDLSLAKYLHEHGWDVWLLELRGAGQSSKPRPWNRLRYNWNLDDYIFHDVPAAIRFVQQASGREKIHWMGHSLGGMLAYAFMCTHGNEWAKSVVTIGSPSMRAVRNSFLDQFSALKRLMTVVPRTPHAVLAPLAAPLVALSAPWTARLVLNPENMRRSDISRLVKVAIENIPTTLIKQLWDWYEDASMVKHYGFLSYTDNLEKITAPLYVIAGADDRLTPAHDCRIVYDLASSEDKKFDEFGRASGCRHDYGHIDLVLGRHAREEVWPHILAWLNARTDDNL